MTTSRYDPSQPLTLTDRDGRTVSYLRRRFVPRASSRPVADKVVVVAGDRADVLAARTLGDPELAWCLADANDVRRPSELATAGRLLVVPTVSPGTGHGA